MKFGFCPRFPDDADGMARLIQQTQLAQESGFDSVWLSDDGLWPGSDSAALVAASAVAACTSSLRVGVLVPLGLSHPLYTTEDVAVLDNISGGRVIVAVQPYSVGGAAARERFAEALEVCLRGWAPAPFRFEGRHFRVPANLPRNDHAAAVTQLSVTPKPAQPALPVWMLAVDEETVRLAARLGLPLAGPAGDPLDGLRAKVELYRSLLGREAIGAPLALIRDIDLSNIGAAIEEMERYRDELGANYLICRLERPGMAREEVAQAIHLMGSSVIPEFRMFGYPRELRPDGRPSGRSVSP